MLGPTKTAISPDVAPVGIVIVMEVALHELIVTAVSFRRTALLPCEAPNPEPEMTTWLPTGPVVEDRLVITGAVIAVELSDTLSKVAVNRVDLFVLLIARPM
jgi:hypothetical protein